MAMEPRGPDILTRTAPALSATSDQPLVTTERPPISASNDPADRAAGIPAEISPEARAAAAAARQDGSATPGDGKPGDQPGGDDGKPAGGDKAGEGDGKTPASEAAGGENQPGSDDQGGDDAGDGADRNDWPEGTPEWAKREITISRRQQREARAEAKRQSDRADQLARDMAALRQPEPDPAKTTPAEPPPFEQARPTREAHADDAAYEEALITWSAAKSAHETTWRNTQAAQAAKEKADRETREAAAQETLKTLTTNWEGRREKMIEAHPDYEQFAEADDLPISTPMAHACFADEHGPQMMYYLGKNPAEAARIYAIKDAGLQLLEMGKLSAKVSTRPRGPAPLPQPIEPVRGARNGVDGASAEPSMEEYAAKRLPEVRGGRKPFVTSGQRARAN